MGWYNPGCAVLAWLSGGSEVNPPAAEDVSASSRVCAGNPRCCDDLQSDETVNS